MSLVGPISTVTSETCHVDSEISPSESVELLMFPVEPTSTVMSESTSDSGDLEMFTSNSVEVLMPPVGPTSTVMSVSNPVDPKTSMSGSIGFSSSGSGSVVLVF